jgi:endonuclease YncB( thermonuclease family)
MRRAALLVLLLVVPGCAAVDDPTPGPPGFVDRDCADFATQAKAQGFFERKGGPGTDPHLLDPDHDGIACETRPCPCLGFDAGEVPVAESPPAEVVYVSDGDTIGVRRNGTVVPVRLLGIDAPETKHERECGGGRSTNRLEKLLPRGTGVTLVTDPTQDDEDRFGRLLRYVELNGTDIGLVQVATGFAAVYDYDRPVFSRFDRYDRAGHNARRRNAGNWERCGAADGGS